jgi:peptidoglycan/LPS O-acetylase OafA/YrhL
MSADRLLHPQYRRDIDGLRAIAVLSVVGFHAAPGRIPGGFIGVDIFFVISGYLISTIIAQNLGASTFSFATFYQRRVKRIFPALLAVLTMCLVSGSLLLTTDEYKELAKQIASGAGFYSNFLFWAQSGYFDSDAAMKPLLHLWSLSIEEQFYIVWPLLLWTLGKRSVPLLWATIILALLSFGANLFVVSRDTVASFYSPLTRSWELLSGAILAISALHYPDRVSAMASRYKHALSFTGAGLVLAGLILINEKREFPGAWALLPVLGTTLLIAATEQAWFNRVILSQRVLVWFGLISYPLYLTHWPLLSFMRILESDEVPQLQRLAAVAAAIVFAWMLYTWIETPLRRGGSNSVKVSSMLSAMAALLLAGLYIDQQQGNAGRLGAPPLAVNSGDIGHRPFFDYMRRHYYPCMPDQIRQDMEYWEEFQRCYQSHQGGTNDVAIVGDSHAEHLFIGLANALVNLKVVYYAKGGPPLLSNPKFDEVFRFLSEDRHIKVVLISAKWAQALEGIDQREQTVQLRKVLDLLLASGKTVYLMDDVPEFAFGPSKCKYAGRLGQKHSCQQGFAATGAENAQYYPLFASIAADYPTVQVINTQGFFCHGEQCEMSSDGMLHFRDRDHLNADGSIALWRYLKAHTPLLDNITALWPQ